MNSATHGREGNASAPVLYMALELSNTSWRLALSDGVKRRQVVAAAALMLSANLNLGASDVRTLLATTAKRFPGQAGWTRELGHGRLDVGAAVAAAKAHA